MKASLKIFLLLGTGVLLIGTLSSCDLFKDLYSDKEEPPPSEPPVETRTVEIFNFSFQPSTIRVKAGAVVTWLQRDMVIHTVTATRPAGFFDSGDLSQGQRFSFTFATPDTYEYHCKYHPNMRGQVIVE